ncbi:HD-GYP domain-containing protein [Selenomonas sp. TAMA-11512]|uniref:HD-GYP domain-containing protein n=1 Tax=Selenomonas sp. TAMA-11512 TaxID=3095337 RepID=UPI00308612A4|nr:HD-GYP domain-containing protein [Selenomonas sp. TAMA-11512]
MINLPLSKLRDGMVTAQSIYNPRGTSFLTQGMELNRHYIDRLQKIGIENVVVTSLNPALKLKPPPNIVQEKTRITAIHCVSDIYDAVEKTGTFDTKILHNISKTILHDLIDNRANLVQLTDIRLHDSYTFAHSVNVTVLSAMMGMLCHYSPQELTELTNGALLHDLGKTIIPQDVLIKPAHLSADEEAIVRQHPKVGRDRLKAIPNLPPTAGYIAMQHHEHVDGSGYPNHMTAKQIHRFAKIVTIADVYDALTSMRPYKKAYSPSVAYRIMKSAAGKQFDADILKKFFDNVAIYPVGTILRTKLGFGIVKRVDFGRTRTPVMCLFANADGKVLDTAIDIDLYEHDADTILGVLDGSELYHFVHQIHMDPAVLL